MSFSQNDQSISENVKAKLVLKKAYNKVGKEMKGEGDFYLKIGREEIFVKLSSSMVTRDELSPLLDKKSKFKIIRSEGLWDTDNPEVQSRIGPYVSIVELL